MTCAREREDSWPSLRARETEESWPLKQGREREESWPSKCKRERGEFAIDVHKRERGELAIEVHAQEREECLPATHAQERGELAIDMREREESWPISVGRESIVCKFCKGERDFRSLTHATEREERPFYYIMRTQKCHTIIYMKILIIMLFSYF